jgi:glycosyltransferase involved in cell wall biosynthesis
MISIVIPVHNEAGNIEDLINKFIDDLGVENIVYEILLVENGSVDGTAYKVKLLVEKYSGLVKFHQIEIPSYGEAIKFGMRNSVYDIIFIFELDFLKVDFIRKSIDKIQNNHADIVVGSKLHPESNDTRSFKRRTLTFLFNKFLKFYFNFNGTDTHGLKAFKKDAFYRLDRYTITTDEIYQTELILLASKLNLLICEVPVEISEIRSPSVSILKRVPKVINIISQLKKSLNRDIY